MNRRIIAIRDRGLWLVYRLNDDYNLMGGVQHIATLSTVENVFVFESVNGYDLLVLIDDQDNTTHNRYYKTLT